MRRFWLVLGSMAIALALAGGCVGGDDGAAVPAVTPTAPVATCAELRAAWTAGNRGLLDLSLEHPRAFVTGFRTALTAIEPVTAPAGIAPAWQEFRDYLVRANTALEDVDAGDASAVTTAFSGAITADETAAAGAAAASINEFLDADCGEQ